MQRQNELLDAIEIIVNKALENKNTRVTGGNVKSASGGLATVTIAGVDYQFPYSGTAPTVGSTCRVFIPNGNMSDAFIGASGGGGGSSTTNYNSLTNKPKINGVELTGNKTSVDLELYGADNEPNYPVTSVNNKTGDVNLTASDVGAISTGDISQTLGTSTTKVPSEKAVSDALSAAGAGGMLKSAYDPNNTVADAGGIADYVDANGGKIDTIKVNGAAQIITNKTVDINVPTNTNQLTNGAGFITSSQAPVQSVNGKTGNVELTKANVELGNVANERQYSAENPPPYPVTSVNGMTGDVNIEVAGGGVNIVLSATQPTDLKTGDYWYQIIT